MASTYIALGLAGVASHLFYFQRGEHHIYGVLYIKILFTAIVTGISFLTFTQETPLPTATLTVLKLISMYLAGIYTSLLTYRVLLHPLNKFPGPLAARLSALYISAPLGHNVHLKLYDLHKKYGHFVRIGSNDLSIAHPDAIEIVYGPNSRCIKGQQYELSHPTTALQLMRNEQDHHTRRRIWSHAFSDKLIRGYETRIKSYRRQLVSKIRELSANGQNVDVKKWFDLYSFDVMGDLSFGKGFESLEAGEPHWVANLLSVTSDAVGMFLPSWLFQIMVAVPGVSKDFWRFVDVCGERLVERFRNDPEIPDVSTSLFKPLKGRDILDISTVERNILYGDARLIVIAGSDTTAGTLSTVIYSLLHNPAEIQKLRAELEPLLNTDGDTPRTEFPHSQIANLDHLNGVINEALRLYPVVPSQLQRVTPSEGIVVDGVHVPGGTQILVPLHTIGFSELAYEQPTEFIPERWYSRPELIKHKGAFAPFSIGPFNCIGRPLALMNLRTTIAQLIMDFDIAFAPGEDGSRFLRDAKDNFVYYFGGLDVLFTPREV